MLVLGFGAAVAVWVAAFVAHLPWLDLPEPVSGPIVLAVWLVAAAWGARLLGLVAGRWTICALSGLVTALLTVLILGSLLVEQPAIDGTPRAGTSGLGGHAVVLMAGFLVLGVVLGLFGCLFGGSLAQRSQSQPFSVREWHARLATVAAVSVVPLLIIGGKVTSAKAGMSIIGWPNSDGANMFLYPIALMANPQRFLEHTHRLFGTLVGLTFFWLMVYTFVAKHSRAVRLYAVALFVAVVLQGVIGAVRVTNNSPVLAAVHGVFAQLFFAGAVAFAARSRGLFERGFALLPEPTTALRLMSTVAFCALIVQLTFGAMYRHLGSPHALWSHIGFSVAVVALCSIVGARLKRTAKQTGKDDRAGPSRAELSQTTLRRVGSGLSSVVGLQFLLGFAALWAAVSVGDRTVPVGAEVLVVKQVPVVAMLVRTAHQVNGALLMALASLALVWSVWLVRGHVQHARAGAKA